MKVNEIIHIKVHLMQYLTHCMLLSCGSHYLILVLLGMRHIAGTHTGALYTIPRHLRGKFGSTLMLFSVAGFLKRASSFCCCLGPFPSKAAGIWLSGNDFHSYYPQKILWVWGCIQSPVPIPLFSHWEWYWEPTQVWIQKHFRRECLWRYCG